MAPTHPTDALPSTCFIIVRHGQARSADGGYRQDTPLSDVGTQQAALTAEALRSAQDIQAIYCSPYPRALQTAQPIARRLGKAAIAAEDLAEFEIAERPLAALASRPDLVIWRPEHRGVDGGETVEQFFRRVGTFCETVCSRHRDGKVVLVTHAGTIDAAFRWAIGVAPREPWTFELEVPNASITELVVWPAGRVELGAPRHTVVQRIGDARHLGGLVSGI